MPGNEGLYVRRCDEIERSAIGYHVSTGARLQLTTCRVALMR
jgi:hypothetical protein